MTGGCRAWGRGTFTPASKKLHQPFFFGSSKASRAHMGNEHPGGKNHPLRESSPEFPDFTDLYPHPPPPPPCLASGLRLGAGARHPTLYGEGPGASDWGISGSIRGRREGGGGGGPSPPGGPGGRGRRGRRGPGGAPSEGPGVGSPPGTAKKADFDWITGRHPTRGPRPPNPTHGEALYSLRFRKTRVLGKGRGPGARWATVLLRGCGRHQAVCS